jgi:hypothetical protein
MNYKYQEVSPLKRKKKQSIAHHQSMHRKFVVATRALSRSVLLRFYATPQSYSMKLANPKYKLFLPQSLQDLTQEIRRDVLLSCVVFPRTSSLREDPPVVTIDVSGTLDWNDIRKKVLTHQEIVAIRARDDLSMITDLLEEFSEELVLHKFDMIQIYKGGLDILRIVNTKSQDEDQFMSRLMITEEMSNASFTNGEKKEL